MTWRFAVEREGLTESHMPLPLNIRAVFFDAVGTVLEPSPPVRLAYLHAGRRHGHEATEAEVDRRFRGAFAAEEERDRASGLRTNEAREEQRWRSIVATTLPGVPDQNLCYRELHEHFGRPEAWQVLPGAAEIIEFLVCRGMVVGIASNFDARLHAIVRSKQELAQIGPVVVSSEIGWRKPAPEFFQYLSDLTGLEPSQILMVGDDAENDVAGPRRAGMASLLVSPARPHTNAPGLAAVGSLLDANRS